MSSIIWVHERHEEWSGGRTEKGDYEFTRAFDVLTDTRNVGPYAVLSAEDPDTGLAIPGDFDDYHAGDDALTFAFVKSKSAKRNAQQPKLWQVEVRYSTAKDQQQKQETTPTDRPPVYTWDTVNYQKVARKDVDGNPIVNSVDERFNPSPEMDDSRLVLRVERNEATFTSDLLIDYMDAVNTDEFFGFEPGTAKMAKISASSQYENSVFFWKVTYEIHFRREGWTLDVLNESTYSLAVDDADNEVKELFYDRRGQVMQSGLIDTHGAPLGTGDLPVFLVFDVYRKKPFNVLSL